MPRLRGTGTVSKGKSGRWIARVRWRDETGRRHEMRRYFATRAAAIDGLEAFNAQRERLGPDVLGLERRTFDALAELFVRTYCGEPVYRQGVKVAGMRARRVVLERVEMLRQHFGTRRVRDITTGEIERFKAVRLATPVRGSGRPRSIATVNRELAVLRRVLNVAVSERWIDRNPFRSARPLIQMAAEAKRDRVLSRDEEVRLIAACPDALCRLVVCAVDTGCRQGELLGLQWADVDLVGGRITVRAANSKTMRARSVPLTRRVVAALGELGPGDAGESVFGPTVGTERQIRTAWARACKVAAIDGLRFHDLRATCGTRLATAGVPLTEVARILGHSDVKTTFRYYVGEGEGSLDRAAAALERFVDQGGESPSIN